MRYHIKFIFFLFLFPFIFSICLPLDSISNNAFLLSNHDSLIDLDYIHKSLKIPCIVNINSGVVEWVLSYNGFRGYESFLQTSVNPIDLQNSLADLGYYQVCAYKIPDEQLFNIIENKNSYFRHLRIFLTWQDSTGIHTKPIETFFKDAKTHQSPTCLSWYFNSFPFKVDRAKARQIPLISKTHTNVPYSVIELNSPYLFDYYILEIDKSVAPIPGTKAILTIQKFKKNKNKHHEK